MIETAQAFILGLYLILNGTTFLLMFLGMMIGFVVGILPGLGGPTTLALMLPFIVKMKAVEAFALLLGMAAVTNTTGDITSILFGVPGEPTCAATIVDGHPMAKKGEAGRALGAALLSSLVGALFGAFSLALTIPIIRPLVLAFGSPELFMVTLVGLTFVASLGGSALLKGLIASGIGLFFSTVGVSPLTSVQRFTFGQLFLWDGIGLVPITIGFFAIPELIDLAIQGLSIAKEQVGKIGGVMEGVKDTFRHWWLTIRCSAIGTFVGIIPGMGNAVTQWLAYAHAVQSSPNQERFGKGAVEGVLGPGAANNSHLGGSLVTTIAFGLPASVAMAILLGAFLIQGIVPGPDMLIPEQHGGHLALTYSFVWTIVFTNIFTVAICLLFLNQLAKVTQVRGHLLIPFILLLIYLGAFAEKNVFEDVLLVLIFGCLGWVMQEIDWPRPPLILGLVLGPLAENRLFLSMDNYGFEWLLRPGVLILMVLTLAGAFYPIFQKKRRKRRGVVGGSPSHTVDDQALKKGSRLSGSMLFSVVIMVLSIAALWESKRFSLKAGLFPWTIGFAVLLLSSAQLVKELLGKNSGHGMDHLWGARAELPRGVANRRTAAILGWIIGFFLAIWLLGFSIAGVFCTFIYLKIGSREKWPMALILTTIVWAIIEGMFHQLLYIPFPPGQLFVWLGLA